MTDTQRRFYELAKQAEKAAKNKPPVDPDAPPDVPEELRLQPSDRKLPEVKKSHTAAVVVALLCVFLVLGGGAAAGWFGYTNYTYQKPMDELTREPENAGFHFKVTPDVMLQNITIDATDWPDDAHKHEVIRILMTYAGKIKELSVKQVTLSCHGTAHFTLDGDYFKEVGAKFGVKPDTDIGLIRTFPEHVVDMKGEHPYPHIQAASLEDTGRQLRDFGKLIDAWTCSK